MKTKKILSIALSTLLLFTAAGCTPKQEIAVQRTLTDAEIQAISAAIPNYSSNDKKFEFFAYSAASDGYWTDSGVEKYCGEDLRTVEQFTMYKDAGLTFMHPQGSVAIQGTDLFVYESSQLKRLMDTAEEAGIGRVIVPDYRLNALMSSISNGCRAAENPETFDAFEDTYDVFTDEGELVQEAIENKVREFMGEYSQHPAFYGVVLDDEPATKNFVGYGHVYRAIKRVYPDAFRLCNLFPPAGFKVEHLNGLALTQEELDEFEDTNASAAERLAAWKKYISLFLEITQCDYLMYDQYPISDNGIHDLYLRGLQIAAELCKEKGIQLCLVTQTMALNSTRTIDEGSGAWLNNMLLGLGVKMIGYFTYFDRSDDSSQDYYEGGSFVTHFGKKTKVYDVMQKIMSQNKKMQHVFTAFDYSASGVYSAELANYQAGYIGYAVQGGTYQKVASVTIDKASALVSELYDKTNNRYMYMIQNIVDPVYTGSASYQTVTLTFSEAYQYALVLCDGEQQVVKLVNNQYSVTQHPAKAVYVIPFNA